MVLKLGVKVFLVAVFTMLISSSVLADDGRINRAPYHFGGDTLYCNQQDGCTLLNITGLSLGNWSQDEIGTAIAATDQTGQNTQVGVRQGTYGPIQLWVVSPDATTGNNTLCLIGFDEWGKENDMCFPVTPDFQYQQAQLPAKVVLTAVPTAVPTVEPTVTSTPEPTGTPTATATSTATGTPTATATSSPTATATSSPTATATSSPTATATSSPTATATATSTPADCSMWSIGNAVQLKSDYMTWGTISAIDSGTGTVTFGAHTAGCDEIEYAG